MLQQTSNWLLSLWERKPDIPSGFGVVDFIRDYAKYTKIHFDWTQERLMREPELLQEVYKALVVRLLGITATHVTALQRENNGAMAIKNNSQMFLARSIALIFVEHIALDKFVRLMKKNHWNPNELSILQQLGALYACWRLEKHIGHLYESGIMSHPSDARYLMRAIVDLSRGLLPNAVALVDVLAPPDFILKSPLGLSDGEIYKNIHAR